MKPKSYNFHSVSTEKKRILQSVHVDKYMSRVQELNWASH